MNAPVFNEKTVSEAFDKALIPLKNAKLEFDIASFYYQGQEILKCFDSKGQEDSELAEKSILIASISKAVTATAVARMVDKGLVNWSDPLCKYLDELKDGTANESIRIADVFLHRTGYSDLDTCPDPAQTPPCEAYKELIKKEPLFKPGTAFKYGTQTYWFINGLVNKVLGQPSMEEFLKEWVFEPCGMKNTTFKPDPDKAAEPYYLSPVEMENYMGMQVPGSGLWSCPADLMNLAKSVITPGKLMSEKTFKGMTEAYPMVKFSEEGFSCRTPGWVKEIKFNNQPQRGFFHGGATGGVLWCDPEYDFIALFMTSKWNAGNDDAFNMISTFYAG